MLAEHRRPHVAAVQARVAVLVDAEHGEIAGNSRNSSVVGVETVAAGIRHFGADCCGKKRIHFGRKQLAAPEDAASGHHCGVQRREAERVQRLGGRDPDEREALQVPVELGL